MWLIRSKKASGVIVEVVKGGNSLTTKIGGLGATTSDLMTTDMKTQMDLGYILCQLKGVPDPEPVEMRSDLTIPDMGQGALLAAVDQHEAKMRGEANDVDNGFYTEDEFNKMKVGQLRQLISDYELNIKHKQSKSKLVASLTKYEIPKE